MVDPTQLSREELEALYRAAVHEVIPGHEPAPAPTNGSKPPLHVHIDQQRVKSKVPVDTIIAMQEGDLKAMLDCLSYFVVGEDGGYLPYDQARPLLGKLSMDQLMEIARQFDVKAQEIAVPLASAG